MANVGEIIKNATQEFVNGNFWMDNCPKEASLDEWIVCYSLGLNPMDYGDDRDLEWEEGLIVKWVHKGNVNYYDIRKKLRDALRNAGLSLGNITSGYDGDDNRTNVMLVVYGLE